MNLTVTIPAKNEEALIERTLRSLVEQRFIAVGSFDVIVFANDCTDRTAERVRAFSAAHPYLRITLLEDSLPSDRAHIGTARRVVMDAGAARFEQAGTDGIIASTDADTVVGRTWIAHTIAAMNGVDAVAGRVRIVGDDLRALPQTIRAAYAADGIYHRLVARLEATYDPLEWDPAPRHADHFGGSFAVRASAYRRVGGVPNVTCLEDVALFNSLLRMDCRVRHAPSVRVWTSGRLSGRVSKGYATHLDALATLENWCVEEPQTTIDRIRLRGMLRAAYVVRDEPFGTLWNRRARAFDRERAAQPLVPFETACASFRRAIASANAALPTRNIAASGAG